jgi:hypothetical protein
MKRTARIQESEIYLRVRGLLDMIYISVTLVGLLVLQKKAIKFETNEGLEVS